MSQTVFGKCFYCGNFGALYPIFHRDGCRECRNEILTAPPLPPLPPPHYEAPRLVTYGDIGQLTKGTW